MTGDLTKVVEDVEATLNRARSINIHNPDRDQVIQIFAALHKKDQAFRTLYVAALKADRDDEMQAIRPLILSADAENRAWFRSWLDSNGWPLRSDYGDDPSQTAWLIALHSDIDLEFQCEVFRILESLFRNKDVTAVEYAGLSDRIAINEGREQCWGMFYRIVDGEEALYPVENESELQERRADLGLGDEKFHR